LNPIFIFGKSRKKYKKFPSCDSCRAMKGHHGVIGGIFILFFWDFSKINASSKDCQNYTTAAVANGGCRPNRRFQ
jgi:hypothetical protein